jgi:hypothetical protein
MLINVGAATMWGAGIGAFAAFVIVFVGATLSAFFTWGGSWSNFFSRNLMKPLKVLVVIGAIVGFIIDNAH